MTNLNTHDAKRLHRAPPIHTRNQYEDAFALTWLIGVATAIVAGGYLFLAQSTRDDLKAINGIANQSAYTVTGEATPLAAYSPLAEPPSELRK